MPGATEELLDSFARTTEEIVTLEEFKEKLASGRKLRIKYGVDVTAPLLHLGHAVNLWMMREMQDAGHTVVFLIGDFTTRVGDPTGKSQTRPVISREEIGRNAEEFITQVSTILRTEPEVFEVRRNSEWWDAMSLDGFMSLLSMVNHGRLIARDMFQRRIEDGGEIHMHEFLYPVLQGYDSYALESDLTIVGTDQLFNEMMGRFYQSRLGQHPQIVITTKITAGLDGGEKMSKSLGNFISIAHSPRDMFGRTMSIPDDLIIPYLEVYTSVPSSTVDEMRAGLGEGSAHPMDAKRFLAQQIVSRYYGDEVATEESEWFTSTFSRRVDPTDAPVVTVPAGTSLFGVIEAALDGTSRKEIRRLLAAGGVSVDGVKEADPDLVPGVGSLLRVGKRRFFRVAQSGETTEEG